MDSSVFVILTSVFTIILQLHARLSEVLSALQSKQLTTIVQCHFPADNNSASRTGVSVSANIPVSVFRMRFEEVYNPYFRPSTENKDSGERRGAIQWER
jgi:hypothetical protein